MSAKQPQLSSSTQLPKLFGRKIRKLAKRLLRRKRRHEDRRDPENVPARLTGGWVD